MIKLSLCNYDSLVILLINTKEGFFQHLIKGFPFSGHPMLWCAVRGRESCLPVGENSFDSPFCSSPHLIFDGISPCFMFVLFSLFISPLLFVFIYLFPNIIASGSKIFWIH